MAPGRPYFPVAQVTVPEQEDDVSPGEEPYFPDGHFAQTVSSESVLDLAPATAYDPAGHVTTPEQALEVLPPEPYVPAGQIMHVEASFAE